MRKHAKHTLAGIIQDDHMTAGRVVDTPAEFEKLTMAQRKRTDIKGWDTARGKAKKYDRKIIRQVASAKRRAEAGSK